MAEEVKLLKIKDAAELLGVNPETLRRWDRSGKLKAVIISPRGDRRYRLADLEKFVSDLKTSLEIVPATSADVPEIQKLLKSTWKHTYGYYLSQATLDEVYKNWQSIEFLTRQVENPQMYFPIAKVKNKLLGIATAHAKDDLITLFRLYVYPDSQRRGIGALLLNNVVSHFPKAQKIQLHVEELNQKGQSFYKKEGFKEVKREKEKVVNEVVEQILMEKEL